MAQFINLPQSARGRLSDVLGQSIGEGLSNFTGNYFASKALDKVLSDPEMKNADLSQRQSKLQAALQPYGQYGENIFQKRLQVEQQQEQEQEQKVLADIYADKEVAPEKFSKLSPQNQLKAFELKKKRQLGSQIKQSLMKAGYPEETASLWQQQMDAAPVGGQTDVIKNVNDLLRRSKSGKGMTGEETKNTLKPSIDIPGIQNKEYELDFPELPEPIGMTPSDVVKQNEYREKTNIPLYNETVDRLNALDDEYREVKHLEDLNEIPGALPTGVEKWNVNWDSGDLRVKALATPEAQDYVKTIARMARRAKDFFPGRVTNFDLDQFKQGFPTLANDPKGRRLIAQQLALGNRIAYLKDETFKAAMDHYGSGADPVLIKKYATENYRRLKSELEDQLKQVNQQAKSMVDQETERPSLEDIFK